MLTNVGTRCNFIVRDPFYNYLISFHLILLSFYKDWNFCCNMIEIKHHFFFFTYLNFHVFRKSERNDIFIKWKCFTEIRFVLYPKRLYYSTVIDLFVIIILFLYRFYGVLQRPGFHNRTRRCHSSSRRTSSIELFG